MRIEGCLWHSAAESAETDELPHAATRFARYMTLASRNGGHYSTSATKGDEQTATLISDKVPSHNSYRVVGGVADGMVFDVSEEQGDIRLRLYVPDPKLLHHLTSIATPFIALMRQNGLVVSLEILNATVTI